MQAHESPLADPAGPSPSFYRIVCPIPVGSRMPHPSRVSRAQRHLSIRADMTRVPPFHFQGRRRSRTGSDRARHGDRSAYTHDLTTHEARLTTHDRRLTTD